MLVFLACAFFSSCRDVTYSAGDTEPHADQFSTLMPWNGRTELMIDRFDVRAFMDVIPRGWDDTGDLISTSDEVAERGCRGASNGSKPRGGMTESDPRLECFLGYERYRSLMEAVRRKVEPSEHLELVSFEVRRKLAHVHNEDSVPTKSDHGRLPSKPPSSDLAKYGRVGYMYAGEENKEQVETDTTLALLSMVGDDNSSEEDTAKTVGGNGDEDTVSDLEELLFGDDQDQISKDVKLDDQDVEKAAEALGAANASLGYTYERLLRWERKNRETLRARRATTVADLSIPRAERRRRRRYADQWEDKSSSRPADRSSRRRSPSYKDYDRGGSRDSDRRRDTKDEKGREKEYITCFDVAVSDVAERHDHDDDLGNASSSDDGPGIGHKAVLASFFPALHRLSPLESEDEADLKRQRPRESSKRKDSVSGGSRHHSRCSRSRSPPIKRHRSRSRSPPIKRQHPTRDADEQPSQREKAATSAKAPIVVPKAKLTPAEKLKLKMQKMMNRTLATDKKQQRQKLDAALAEEKAAERMRDEEAMRRYALEERQRSDRRYDSQSRSSSRDSRPPRKQAKHSKRSRRSRSLSSSDDASESRDRRSRKDRSRRSSRSQSETRKGRRRQRSRSRSKRDSMSRSRSRSRKRARSRRSRSSSGSSRHYRR